MIEIDTTILSLLFAVFGIFYSVLLTVMIYLQRKRPLSEGHSADAVFSLLVPARNEEAVLRQTLESLLDIDYPTDKFEIVVMDDGSTDRTAEIAVGLARTHPGRLHLVRMSGERAGRGKSEALNLGFRSLLRNSRFRGNSMWIVGVFDADGVPDRDVLRKAGFPFIDPQVGAVQCSVRIANRRKSWLARMQDLEFAAFSRVTQMIRARLADSASLGGNGQFVRASALEGVAISQAPKSPRRFWRPGALAEDLELSTRLSLQGWKIRHLATAYVHQEGVERFRDLLRQRTRWAWGSLQVFVEYVAKMKVFRARHVPLRRRVDLAVTLSLFVLSPLVLFVWVLTFLSFAGVVGVSNLLPGLLTIGISFGFFPLVAWGMWQQREYRRARLPLDLLLFTAYTYHWLPCLYVAILRMVGGDDPRWLKTRRVAQERLSGTRPRWQARVSAWATPPHIAGLLAFLVLAAVAGYLRWSRAAFLDPFEDPYQHWWISGYMIETGLYFDSFSAMTQGNWLPLYDFGISGLFPLFGTHNMAALKAVSLVFSLATMALVFLIGLRAHGLGAAWAAAAIFAFTPSAILGGSMALPEAATGLTLVAGYYLLFLGRGPTTWRYGLASASLLAAVALRYEAWFFIALLLAFFLSRKPTIPRGDILLVVSPALLFATVWLLFTSRWGFLPDIVIAQTSVDVRYKASIGALPELSAILGDFWSGYVALSLVPVLLGTAYSIRFVRREFLAFSLLAFYGAEIVWTAFSFGNPSIRYLYVTLPGLAVLAGMFVSSTAKRLRAFPERTARPRLRRAGSTAGLVVLALVVGVVVLDGESIAFPNEPPGFFMSGRERAGLFLRDLVLPEDKLLLSESPIAAYLSGLPPARMIGSSLLPDDSRNATAFLVDHVAYFILVTVPWYKLRVLFPELADGVSTPVFRLMYDATGPEFEAGGHRVLVYEVVSPSGGSPP